MSGRTRVSEVHEKNKPETTIQKLKKSISMQPNQKMDGMKEKCVTCSQCFKTKRRLNIHISGSHPQLKDQKPRTDSNTKPVLKKINNSQEKK